jgi:hypothetical protein
MLLTKLYTINYEKKNFGYRWHGKGTFTHANGKVEEGIWKNNKLVKSK